MKQKNNNRLVFKFVPALLLWGIAVCLAVTAVPSLAGSVLAVQKGDSKSVAAVQNPAVTAFEEDVKEYAKLREGLEEKLPKLHKESTPEQIEAHKKAFEAAVRTARSDAKPGSLFTPEIAAHIRATIKNEFKGAERQELREEVLDADTKGVPLRVNYPYPETKELTQIPPTLLLKLPQLPKQVRYRFVGQHLLLVDRENGLIIDYMLNALP
ncbi:MAG TPA: hypothetical protein VF666_09915 [Pyrinomonadaceae bacterium]|jgi:hypothetical protein